MVEKIPESFEETILSYLKGQEIWPEDTFDIQLQQTDGKAKENIEDILRELLLKVDKRIACRDRYENLKHWHNQYPLFDLNDFLGEFCMDDEMMQKLSFRETLLVSELDNICDDRSAQPTPVGGLSLNVTLVDGHMPDELRQKATEAEMDSEILQTWQRAKQVSMNLKYSQAENESIDDDELRDKLAEYERFLKNEMKENVKKFAVHLSSQFDVGFNGGSRITGWIDRNFHTLEEKRTEYVKDSDETFNEKTVYIAIQNNKYYLRSTSLQEDFEERKYYSFAKARHFIGESANFVLMRYLAVIRYSGTFELSTIYINGDMCRNIYECTGPMMGTVNDENIEICKIYRYIIEECGIEHHCVTVLTVHGKIVTQEWEGCNLILNLNPLEVVGKGEANLYEKYILEKTWMDDMELLSKYLDCKTEAEMKMKTFMSDHAEVKNILEDYLNNILLLKPDHILTFTEDFFQELCPIKIARMGYLDTDKEDYEGMF